MADASLLIEYSNDGGDSWATVVSGLSIDFGADSYDWIVPSDTTVSGLIRLTDIYTDTVLDTSNVFSIQSFDSITELIINPQEDPKLIELQNWALATSWCSRAVIETFSDPVNTTTFGEVTNALVIDEYNRASTPDGATGDTIYEYLSKIYTFETDELSELADKSIASTRWTMQLGEEHYGDAIVKVQICSNPGDVDKIWFTWYDTGTLGSTLLDHFPNGYLDYSRKEILAFEGDVFNKGLLPTTAVQIKITIITDSDGNGGYVDYFALLADPDLF